MHDSDFLPPEVDDRINGTGGSRLVSEFRKYPLLTATVSIVAPPVDIVSSPFQLVGTIPTMNPLSRATEHAVAESVLHDEVPRGPDPVTTTSK